MFFVFSLFLLFSFNLNSETINLKKAIDYALGASPQILKQQQTLIYSKNDVRKARLMFLPSLNLSFDMLKNFGENNNFIWGEDYVYREAGRFDSRELYGLKLFLTLPVYKGGELKTNLELTKIKHNQEKNNYEIFKHTTVTEVKKAYYRVLYYKKLYELKKELNQTLENADKKIKEDVYRKLTETEKNLLIARNYLTYLMNKEVNYEYDVEGDLIPVYTELNLDKLIISAISNNPEIKNYVFENKINSILSDLTLKRKFPNFYIGYAYDLYSSNLSDVFNRNKRAENNIIYFYMKYPFPYDFYLNYQQKKAMERKSELSSYELQNKIKFEVNKYYIDYNFYTKTVKLYGNIISEKENEIKKTKNKDGYYDRLIEYYELKEKYMENIYNQINSLIELERLTYLNIF